MKENIKLEDILYGIAKTLEKIIDHCEYSKETLVLKEARAYHGALLNYMLEYGVKITKKVRLK